MIFANGVKYRYFLSKNSECSEWVDAGLKPIICLNWSVPYLVFFIHITNCIWIYICIYLQSCDNYCGWPPPPGPNIWIDLLLIFLTCMSSCICIWIYICICLQSCENSCGWEDGGWPPPPGPNGHQTITASPELSAKEVPYSFLVQFWLVKNQIPHNTNKERKYKRKQVEVGSTIGLSG